FFSVAGGILANAALSGAKTVMPDAELSVSTSPAFFTAVTRVDRTGLLEAAVATGAADMPAKLPFPDDGTAEQPGPNGAIAAVPLECAAAAGDDEPDIEADPPPLDPQAAAVTASPAAATVTISLCFTVTLPC